MIKGKVIYKIGYFSFGICNSKTFKNDDCTNNNVLAYCSSGIMCENGYLRETKLSYKINDRILMTVDMKNYILLWNRNESLIESSNIPECMKNRILYFKIYAGY